MEKYFEELKRFESNFGTAIRSNYTRNIIVKDRQRLNEIYNDLTGTSKRLPVTCHNCLLMILQYLGKAYFDHKEQKEKAEAPGENTTGEPTEKEASIPTAGPVPAVATEEPAKPKRGRKKKIESWD
ncbi:MAG: hypothetical protein LUE93_13365 [Bacteroides sp.]|nr:hypothetical protein [Bacteroides sp.]